MSFVSWFFNYFFMRGTAGGCTLGLPGDGCAPVTSTSSYVKTDVQINSWTFVGALLSCILTVAWVQKNQRKLHGRTPAGLVSPVRLCLHPETIKALAEPQLVNPKALSSYRWVSAHLTVVLSLIHPTLENLVSSLPVLRAIEWSEHVT